MLPIELRQWALRHHVGADALRELTALLGDGANEAGGSGSESRVQSQIRLAAPGHAMRLWRNNCGVLTDDRGVPVRYGLANDNPKLQARLKSADLIGWRQLQIMPHMVGSVVGQFVSIECKAAGWKYKGDAREQGQQRWAALVASEGGFSRFATGPGDLL